MAPNIEAILQRQATLSEVRRRLAAEGGDAAREALAHLGEGPWITLSKQLGSGGVELANALAGALGWQAYDRQILTAIATHTDSRETVLSRLDEHATGSLTDLVNQLIVPKDPGQLAFQQDMMRVIYGLAREGSAIILGRGANWFLKPQFGLRLRIVAPFEKRVAQVAEQRHVTVAEAETRVRENDAEQGNFIRKLFGRAIDDPLGYDLVLNMGGLSPDAAVQIVVASLRRKLDLGS